MIGLRDVVIDPSLRQFEHGSDGSFWLLAAAAIGTWCVVGAFAWIIWHWVLR